MSAIDITNVTPFLLSLAGGGVGVVLFAQLIKKLFGMDSDKAIHVMVILVSGAASVASYALQFKNLPVSVLGLSGPAIYGFSQAVYKTARVLSDLLPKVSFALHKPAQPAVAADAAVAAVDPPAEFLEEPGVAPPAEPAAPDITGFNF